MRRPSSRRSTRRPRTPTRNLYRVFHWLPGARPGGTGHPLQPAPVQGAGRVDNPDRYRVLYASDSPAGAVAEAFGNHAVWTRELLGGRPDSPGTVRAIATLDPGDLETLDLDDARALLRRRLRPSSIVARDRAVTQRWALAIFEERRWGGVRWWSYRDPRWGSFGVWAPSKLRVVETTRLTAEHPALREAATVLARPWMDGD